MVPFVPEAHTTDFDTALTPRSEAVVPLTCFWGSVAVAKRAIATISSALRI
jgi:hypothetical protein